MTESYVPDDAESITDYGAVEGTDSVSAAEANIDAIADAGNASASTSVYVPAGDWYIGDGSSADFLTPGSNGHPAGLSMYGAGPSDSALRLASGQDASNSGVKINYTATDHGTVTWQGLTYDGRRQNIDFGEYGWHRGFVMEQIDECIFRNVQFQNIFGACIRWNGVDNMTLTIDRCTARDIGIGTLNREKSTPHFISGSFTDSNVAVTNSQFELIAGTVIDFDGAGTQTVVDNCYSAGIGTAFIKCNDTERCDISRVYHQAQTDELVDVLRSGAIDDAFDGRHFLYRLDTEYSSETNPVFSFDNVEIRDTVEQAVYVTDRDGRTRPLSLDLVGTGPLACHNIAMRNQQAFADKHDSSLNFDLDQLSVHGVNDDVFGISNGSGRIGTVNWDNADGLGDTGDVSMDATNGGDPFQPTVPARSEVGANTSSSDDGSDGSDDGGSDDGTSDAPIFDEWTPQWASKTDDWRVVTGSEYEGGYALAFDPSRPDRTRYAISWDTVGTPSDVEVVDRFRVPNFTDEDGLGFYSRVHLRSSDGSSGENGYWIESETPESAFRLAKYTDGDLTTLGRFGTPEENTFLYRRFRAEGSQLKVKVWPVTESEPSGWDLEVTDEDHTSGWVGLGSFDPDLVETDLYSVAVGGETAQLPGVDSAPTVTWVAPEDGTTVAGTKTLTLDATDAEDSDDSVIVEYRIDDGDWTEATYNTESGYYEDNWDTTAVTDGEHTLEAGVTDSAGNTSTTVITVTTDNGGKQPTVDSLSAVEVETDNSDAEFDIDWQVSDPDGNLDTVDVSLLQDGTTEDSTSVSVGDGGASDTTRLVASGDDGSGNSYSVELTVTDSKGNTTSDTASVTEQEAGGEAPKITRLSVSESGRPDPHAEVTAIWDVTDVDGDLESVEIDVSSGSETVSGVKWTLEGTSASDTDTFRLKDGDGKSYDVRLTVRDKTGASATETKSVTA